MLGSYPRKPFETHTTHAPQGERTGEKMAKVEEQENRKTEQMVNMLMIRMRK